MEKFFKYILGIFPILTIINTMPHLIKILLIIWFFLTGFLLFMLFIFSGMHLFKNHMSYPRLISPKKIEYMSQDSFIKDFNKYKNDNSKLEIYLSSIQRKVVNFNAIFNNVSLENSGYVIGFQIKELSDYTGKAIFNRVDEKKILPFNEGDIIHFSGKVMGVFKSSIIIEDSKLLP